MELLRLCVSGASSGSAWIQTQTHNAYKTENLQIGDDHAVMSLLTCAFKAQEAGDFVLAVFLFLIGQQLVNELPDQLLGRCVQHWKHIHNESVHIPVYMQERKKSILEIIEPLAEREVAFIKSGKAHRLFLIVYQRLFKLEAEAIFECFSHLPRYCKTAKNPLLPQQCAVTFVIIWKDSYSL